jgi:hypothetical protein
MVLFTGPLSNSVLCSGALLDGSEAKIETACAEAVEVNSIALLVFRAKQAVGAA